MARPFRTFDYDAALTRTFCLEDLLPAAHPARLLVAFLQTLDLTKLYSLYTPIGGHPYDPRGLLALWLYAYMTGVTSSRQLEVASRERIPFLYLAAGRTPDHSTLAEFRTLVFAYLPTLFDDLLTRAFQEGHLTMQAVSHDGTKIHADASKHKAVSYQRAGELIHDLQQQIEDLLHRAQHDPASLPTDLHVPDEIAMRRARIARLQKARQMLEARAEARYDAELAAFAEKQAARAERERVSGKKPRGKPPTPPTPGPMPTDQYNFTDPDARIMKNSTNTGVDQHYNCQATVEHRSRLIVGCALSHQASDTAQAAPSFATIPAALGIPGAACLDAGFWSPATVEMLTARGITPYIAVGKRVHGLDWERYYGTNPTTPPPADASPQVQMAYQLQTPEGRTCYRERKSTVEPVIGILKEVLGFRQFSQRGLAKVQGEWRLACLAYNLKRYFTLQARRATEQVQALAHQASIAAQDAFIPCFPTLSHPSSVRQWLYGVAQGLVRFSKASCRLSPTGC
jgi:transposase